MFAPESNILFKNKDLTNDIYSHLGISVFTKCPIFAALQLFSSLYFGLAPFLLVLRKTLCIGRMPHTLLSTSAGTTIFMLCVYEHWRSR
jgi:hypothetical protein